MFSVDHRSPIFIERNLMQTSTCPEIGVIKVGPQADAMQRTVNEWFGQRTTLLWVPIFDVDDNTTATDVQAAHEEFDGGWLITDIDDLLTLPDGIKGWLIPVDATDTDVACGRWGSQITFMSITDRISGAGVTFRSAVGDNGMPLA